MRMRLVTVAVLCGSIVAIAGEAHGQSRSDCLSRHPASAGVAVGYSEPYLALWSRAVDGGPARSIDVRSGPELAVRTDVPVAGRLRLRLQASTTRWDVRQKTYDVDADFQPIGEASMGHMRARHLVALIGVRGGRTRACVHASLGAGLHSLAFQGEAVRRPGFAWATGIEISTGARGVVQIDMGLYVIDTRGELSMARTAALVRNLTVGWAWRF